MDDESQERDALYEQAERLSNSLVTMGQQLREAVEVTTSSWVLIPFTMISNISLFVPKKQEGVRA